MKGLTRRSALAGLGAASLGLLAGWPTQAFAAWGDPATASRVPPPPTTLLPWPGYKVLEVFFHGGLSSWETFWWDTAATGLDIRSFDAAIRGLSWNSGGRCTDAPSAATMPKQLAGTICLGALTSKLWDDYVFRRMRVIVQRHELKPHEAAIPQALGGHRLGRPELAGMGAAMQHRFLDSLPVMDERRKVPASYVLLSTGRQVTDNFQAAGATGTHGGAAAPVVLYLGGTLDSSVARMNRTGLLGNDPLLRLYAGQYAGQLTQSSVPVRSRGQADYTSALSNLLNGPTIRTSFGTSVPSASPESACVVGGGGPLENQPAQGIELAARLLTTRITTTSGDRPAAAYVCLVDSGLANVGGAGYDTHGGHLLGTSTNMWNILSSLRSWIKTSPTDPTPGRIDLSDTLIILNTEFGRSPGRQGGAGSDARDHWPEGYVTVLIGGPIPPRPMTGGPSPIVGTISGSTGEAPMDSLSPADFRAACLMAAGIEPIVPGVNFSIANLSPRLQAMGDDGARTHLRTQVLGLP